MANDRFDKIAWTIFTIGAGLLFITQAHWTPWAVVPVVLLFIYAYWTA